ncbi:MAG: T9SS type A sorting domain-containing protein [Bacteroidia bacterium]
MMKSEMRNVLVWCLLGLAASTGLYGQTGSYEISNLNDFPKVIIDTNDYSFDLQLVNRDPFTPLDGVFSIYMSINGDQGTRLVTDIDVTSPIAPGDSLEISVSNHTFDYARFVGGGGVTHDIIVWPMRLGSLPPADSTKKSVFYIDSEDDGAEDLRIEVGDFPSRIREGADYDIAFEVVNNDLENILYQPVAIYMQVDGGTPRLIADNQLPELPLLIGQSFTVSLPGHIFDPVDFASVAGGGGITHDIIVWPMKVGLLQGDSAHLQAEYFRTAAMSLEEGVAGLPPVIQPFDTYNIFVAAKNIGATNNTSPIDFYVQLDDGQPQLYYQSSLFVAPDHYVSTTSANFELASYFGYGSGDSAYFDQSHELIVWAVERNALDWHIPAVYSVASLTNANTEMLAMDTNNGASTSGGGGTSSQMTTFNLADATFEEYQGYQIDFVQASVQPNPFQDELEVQYTDPIVGPVSLELYTIQNVLVLDKRWTLASVSHRLSLDTSSLREGLYMYRLEVNGTVYTGKVLKE